MTKRVEGFPRLGKPSMPPANLRKLNQGDPVPDEAMVGAFLRTQAAVP